MGQESGTRAVVLGGSIAGLFAARVLADAYDEVQIVDRDKIVGLRGPRKTLPLSYQANGLLARGVHIMEELFPGIVKQLVDDGIPKGDLSGSCRWYAQGNRLAQKDGDLITLGVLRPVLEFYIRERVQALSNVVFVQEHDIVGIVTTPDKTKVIGARVQARGSKSDRVIDADLVVDATGRGSRTPVWLEQLGYERPEEERKKIDLVYVTQHYKLRPGADPFQGDVAINQIAFPANPRGNVFFKTSDGQLELTTYGLLGDHPPADQDGLYRWLKSLPAKDVYETIRYADPVDEPVPYRFPTTLRRHYQKLTRFPDNLLVTGDAITCFNPVYAQGMSVAALCAITMRQHLHSGAAPVPLDYFRDLAADAIDASWDLTNTVDLSFPGVKGERPLKLKFANWFLKRIQIAATHDSDITAKYYQVAGLMAPQESLMKPGFILRVLLKSMRGPSKESQQPYVYQAPPGVEPVFEDTYTPAELPKAA
jgi:2-polyprenyl-6-methoxyphenol hydroxylase-like FAD-dependent oxidoreductase